MALDDLLEAAARGVFPAPDGRVEVVPSPSGPADAVVAFTAHTVVAADVDRAAVEAQLPAESLSAPLQPPFLTWLGDELRSEAGNVDVLLVAGPASSPEIELIEVGDADHPRVRRPSRYRSELRVYEPMGGGALVVVGRGLAGRYEVAIEVEPGRRGNGFGRWLALAARALVPAEHALFAQVAPGNAASLRAFLGAGYVPIGAEVLFLKDQPTG
jgi:GNAT superfamily N-acetyltransferase